MIKLLEGEWNDMVYILTACSYQKEFSMFLINLGTPNANKVGKYHFKMVQMCFAQGSSKVCNASEDVQFGRTKLKRCFSNTPIGLASTKNFVIYDNNLYNPDTR